MSIMKNEILKSAISANIDVMQIHVAEALEALEIAKAEIEAGNQNGAIGAMLPLEKTLPELNGLFVAILALHRH